MKRPSVAIIVGSKSDLPVIEQAIPLLEEFGISYAITVASAHRTPKVVANFAKNAHRKYDAIIAGAGMAAHLPGVVAAYTTLPVIGVPLESAKSLAGFDALYSIVQMPPGIPVACVAINGAKNAAILAAQIVAGKYPATRKKLEGLKKRLAAGGKA